LPGFFIFSYLSSFTFPQKKLKIFQKIEAK